MGQQVVYTYIVRFSLLDTKLFFLCWARVTKLGPVTRAVVDQDLDIHK